MIYNSASKRIVYDSRWCGSGHGIARFADEIYKRVPGLSALCTRLGLFHPADPFWTSYLLSPSRARAFLTPAFNAPWRCRVPLVLTVHDLNYVRFPANSDPMRRAYFEYLVRPACRRAHRVLTISEFSRAQIAEWARIDPSRIVNVSCGVDSSFTPHGHRLERDRPYLLVIGNERPHKNIERIVDAFARSGLPPDIQLVITGKVGEDVMRSIASMATPQAVELLGYVEEVDLPALYRGAFALCMPSLFEGLGLPVLEAMACGVPVITSTATSLPEAAGDAAILVEPTNTDELADAMRRVATTPSLRADMVTRGLAQSRKFTWAQTAEKVARVLSELD